MTRRSMVARSCLAIACSLVLLALTGCMDPQPHAPPQSKQVTVGDIAIGMQSGEFATIFPGASIPTSGQWTRPDEIHGLRGEWTYSFNKKRLSWFSFNSFDSKVTASTFKQYLDATQSTIAGYTKRYGSPGQMLRGVLQFKDPRQGYPGYPVLKARWNTATEQIQVTYSVLGSAQEKAQLLFTVEVRR